MLFLGAKIEYATQPTPTAKIATGTLTVAELLTKIITCTSAIAVSLTLPTGTLADAGITIPSMPINGFFEWSLINLGSATGAVTMVAGTAHTIVGSVTVAIGTTANFRTRKTAANTYVSYRL